MDKTRLPAAATPSFESLKQNNEHGAEYWSARDLQPLLGYSQWRRFEQAIDRAKASCATSGNSPEHHFAGAGKPITGGKGAVQIVADYHLSRFACSDDDPTLTATAIERSIYVVRGHRIILSGDLAVFYDVEPRVLAQAVKRNPGSFPADFMFVLSDAEWKNLKSQNVISSWGGARSAPMAFTEQGVAMLSRVLRSERAVQVNIRIMRAFVQMRRVLIEHEEWAAKLDPLERKYDQQFQVVFEAIRQLIAPPPADNKRQIGFVLDK